MYKRERETSWRITAKRRQQGEKKNWTGGWSKRDENAKHEWKLQQMSVVSAILGVVLRWWLKSTFWTFITTLT